VQKGGKKGLPKGEENRKGPKTTEGSAKTIDVKKSLSKRTPKGKTAQTKGGL